MSTSHTTHDHYHSRCPACRWERMTPEQQAAIRAERRAQGLARWERKTPDEQAAIRQRGADAWRRQFPERAARRDAILAGRDPEPCAACGTTSDVHAFVTDYEAGLVRWLCRPCAKATRPTTRPAA